MARGWESKSVESQMEERHNRHQRESPDDARTREQLEHTRERESIESSIRGIRRELENARTPVHRAALENALHHLEERLRTLG